MYEPKDISSGSRLRLKFLLRQNPLSPCAVFVKVCSYEYKDRFPNDQDDMERLEAACKERWDSLDPKQKKPFEAIFNEQMRFKQKSEPGYTPKSNIVKRRKKTGLAKMRGKKMCPYGFEKFLNQRAKKLFEKSYPTTVEECDEAFMAYMNLSSIEKSEYEKTSLEKIKQGLINNGFTPSGLSDSDDSEVD
eukprot:TRINITY_DN5329_c0_g1_i2.p1 TRINITY_DN5329_c0_g1~~TRINITY_DN5329_c0_g1_i2.p1  ORF type:complete len:190 (+),score=5.86 TRINITY_DN5329_c0_g1_i2:97-666(+)